MNLINSEEIKGIIEELKTEGASLLINEGVSKEKISFLPKADLRYLGQGYELTINLVNFDIESIKNAFHNKHSEVYGYSNPSEEVELVNLRLRAIGEIYKPKILTTTSIKEPAPFEQRRVFFEKTGWRDTPVFKREKTKWSTPVDGPAIIEQYDSTAVLYPEWIAENDDKGNLFFRRGSK